MEKVRALERRGEQGMDLFFAEPNEMSFVVFNASPLSDEAVTDEDMAPCEARGLEMGAARSAAWSANVRWYFVILASGIILMNVASNCGILCRKKSYKFIEAYLQK